MLPENPRYAYLVIQDLLGARTIYLQERQYWVGGSADCDIQLISATAHECQALFIKTATGYRLADVDLQQGNGEVIDHCTYDLQHGDRIQFAPTAHAVFYLSTEPPEETTIGAKLPIAPTTFPPVEAKINCPH
ncbi:hypothetical protein ACN4EK_09780 [Pantanalinema rosaneae CENA516]|uniref:hypothetical protein n=1 Tax=Pantanalinema rosaneae TaxID=1620701 RepID=UPI003D6E2B4D